MDVPIWEIEQIETIGLRERIWEIVLKSPSEWWQGPEQPLVIGLFSVKRISGVPSQYSHVPSWGGQVKSRRRCGAYRAALHRELIPNCCLAVASNDKHRNKAR